MRQTPVRRRVTGGESSEGERQPLELSRRGFLAGAGVAVGSVSTAVKAAEPSFSVSGGVLTIRLGGFEWVIDGRLWGITGPVTAPRPKLESGRVIGFEDIVRRGRLAGSNMRFDLTVSMFLDPVEGWSLTLRFRNGAAATFTFDEWVGGHGKLEFASPRPGITVGGLRVFPRPGVWSLDQGFTIRGDPRTSIPVAFATDRFAGAAGTLKISPPPQGSPSAVGPELLLQPVVFERLDRNRVAISRAAFKRMANGLWPRGFALTRIGEGWAALLPDPSGTKLTLSTSLRPSGEPGSVVIETRSGSILFGGMGGAVPSLKLRFSGAVFKADMAHIARSGRLQGVVLTPGQGIAIGAVAARIESTTGALDFPADLATAMPPILPVKLTALHVTVPDADRCDIAFDDTIAELHFARAAQSDAATVDLRSGTVAVPLRHARIRLRRALDAFDLTFQLPDHTLAVDRRGHAVLDSRATVRRLVANFPPQHILEEAFTLPDRGSPARPFSIRALLQATFLSSHSSRYPSGRLITDDANLAPLGTRTFLARTLAAGPTRIAFDLPHSGKPSLNLTLASLSDWSDFPLRTALRASPTNLPLELPAGKSTSFQSGRAARTQLELVAIDANTTDRGTARDLIRGSLIAPDQFETALELVTGLIFSPAGTTRFRPPPSPDAAYPALWTASYPGEGSSTRAIWAPDFDPSFISKRSGEPARPILDSLKDGRDEPIQIVPDAGHRRQLVALSSTFALPAMRALVIDDASTPQDSSSSSVRRIEAAYLSKERAKSSSLPGAAPYAEGVYVPPAFVRFEAELSSVGASLDAVWAGEPPAPLVIESKSLFGSNPKGDFFPEAFRLQRYEHKTWLGRDVHAVTEDKGYLFPFGIRVVFVQLTERRYVRFKDTGNVVSYLILRKFIRRVAPEKKFPALYQPFDALDLHLRRFELVTEQTPDLTTRGIDLGSKPLDDKVFWPRLLVKDSPDPKPYEINVDLDGTQLVVGDPDQGREFAFEYRVDGKPEVRRAPLIFVGNDAAHDADSVKALIAYYNALEGSAGHQSLAWETSSGAPTTFASAKRSGDTTFPASLVALSVRPRLEAGKNGQVEALFDMDGFMEGVDQPPFYPVMRYADVQLQSLDRLTGRANGAVRMGYEPTYVTNAFDAAANPSEIYLRVVDDKPFGLDVSNQADSGGGIATGNARLGALSRLIGFVGGGTGGPVTLPADPLNLQPGSTSPIVIKSALSGKSDPLEMFGSALTEARLFGIIPLKDVVRAALITAAPKLVERVEHGVDGGLTALGGALHDIASNLKAQVDSLIGRAANKLIEFIRASTQAQLDPVTAEQWVRDLYPNVFAAITGLEAALDEAARIAELKDPLALPGAASGIVHAGEALVSALESTARDPTPHQIGEILAKLQGWFDRLRRAAQGLGDSLIEQAKKEVDERLAVIGEELAAAGVAEALLGPGDDTGGSATLDAEALKRLLHQLVEEPERVAGKVGSALFARQFGEPLIAALRAISTSVGAAGASTLPVSRQLFAAAIAQVLAAAIVQWARDHPEFTKPAPTQQLLSDIAGTIAGLLPEKIEVSEVAKVVAAFRQEVTARIADIKARVKPAKDKAHTDEDEASNALQTYSQRIKSGTQPDPKTGSPVRLTPADRVQLEAKAAAARARRVAAAASVAALDVLVAILDDRKRAGLLADNLVQEFSRQVGAAVEEQKLAFKKLEGDAKSAATRTATLGADKLLRLLVSTTAFTRLAQAGAKASDWWKHGLETPAVDAAFTMVDALTTTADDANVALTRTDDALAGFDLTRLPSSAALQAFRNCVAETRSCLGRIRAVTGQIAAVRAEAARIHDRLKGELTVAAVQPGGDSPPRSDLLNPAGRALAARNSLTKPIREAAAGLRKLAEKLDDANAQALGLSQDDARIARENLADAGLKVADLARSLTGLGAKLDQRRWDRVKKSMTDAASYVSDAADAINKAGADFEREADRINRMRDGISDATRDVKKRLDALIDYCDALDAFTADLDRNLVSTLLSTIALPDHLAASIADVAAEAAWITTLVLVPPHTVATEIANNFTVPQAIPEEARVLLSLFAGDLLKKFADLGAALNDDRTALLQVQEGVYDGKLSSEPTKVDAALGAAAALSDRWRDGNPALARMLSLVRDMFGALAAGKLGELFNADEVREEIKKQIQRLIPTGFETSYDWAGELGDYPEDDPIFALDRQAWLRNGTEPPPPGRDIVIAANVKVDFAAKTRTATVSGRLVPFKIHLLGSGLDLLTIYFKGASFEIGTDGKRSFDAKIDSVELGTMLEFLKPIQHSFGDFTVFVRLSEVPLGVEAGFEYYNPQITLPGIAFLNVGVGASLFLPFENRPAEIRANFATRDLPFLVMVPGTPPLGGGGFVRLIATARGIIAFEIQIEFGAVVALNYSPLRAQGRITAGIYLLSSNDLRVLEGFVHACGEGQIACFGIAVNIEIGMSQENGGDMRGRSKYSFSFRIGFASFSYSFEAGYAVKGGEGGGQRSAAIENRGARQLADLMSLPASGPPLLASFGAAAKRSCASDRPPVKINVPDPRRHWAEFVSHQSLEW